MEYNQEKAIALKSLYSMVIDYAVSGYLYIDYQRFGIQYFTEPKYILYIQTYRASGYIEIHSNKKHYWIGKYD